MLEIFKNAKTIKHKDVDKAHKNIHDKTILLIPHLEKPQNKGVKLQLINDKQTRV